MFSNHNDNEPSKTPLPADALSMLGESSSFASIDQKVFSEEDVAQIQNQRIIVGDMLSLLQKPSLDGLIAAVVDHVNMASPFTHATKPSTPGSTVVGTVLENYAPAQSAMVRSLVDRALQFGVISEADLAKLAKDPTPLVVPLKGLITNLHKPEPHGGQVIDEMNGDHVLASEVLDLDKN